MLCIMINNMKLSLDTITTIKQYALFTNDFKCNML